MDALDVVPQRSASQLVSEFTVFFMYLFLFVISKPEPW